MSFPLQATLVLDRVTLLLQNNLCRACLADKWNNVVGSNNEVVSIIFPTGEGVGYGGYGSFPTELGLLTAMTAFTWTGNQFTGVDRRKQRHHAPCARCPARTIPTNNITSHLRLARAFRCFTLRRHAPERGGDDDGPRDVRRERQRAHRRPPERARAPLPCHIV